MRTQDSERPPDSQKVPRPVLTFSDDIERGLLLAPCPACGTLSLEIADIHKVECFCCGFQAPLSRFVIQHRDAMHTPDARVLCAKQSLTKQK